MHGFDFPGFAVGSESGPGLVAETSAGSARGRVNMTSGARACGGFCLEFAGGFGLGLCGSLGGAGASGSRCRLLASLPGFGSRRAAVCMAFGMTRRCRDCRSNGSETEGQGKQDGNGGRTSHMLGHSRRFVENPEPPQFTCLEEEAGVARLVRAGPIMGLGLRNVKKVYTFGRYQIVGRRR